MKTLILILAGALAVSVMAFGSHVEESGKACRAAMVEGKSVLVALPLLKVSDQKAPLIAALSMDADDVPTVARALARPIYEAAAYCEMAEKGGK